MSMDLGNELNGVVNNYIGATFELGERINLTRLSLEFLADDVSKRNNDVDITIKSFIGYSEKSGVWEKDNFYSKPLLLDRLENFCKSNLPIEGVLKLTTIMEASLADILFRILEKYPQKISDKVKVDASKIFEIDSISDLRNYLVKRIINDLTYKSPEEFSKEFKDIASVDLHNCSEYEKYIEIKATRDIYIHNNGIVNEIYIRKTKKKARAMEGQLLKCDFIYFYKAYEVCFKILEYLERELHNKWPSQKFTDKIHDFNLYKNKNK